MQHTNEKNHPENNTGTAKKEDQQKEDPKKKDLGKIKGAGHGTQTGQPTDHSTENPGNQAAFRSGENSKSDKGKAEPGSQHSNPKK